MPEVLYKGTGMSVDVVKDTILGISDEDPDDILVKTLTRALGSKMVPGQGDEIVGNLGVVEYAEKIAQKMALDKWLEKIPELRVSVLFPAGGDRVKAIENARAELDRMVVIAQIDEGVTWSNGEVMPEGNWQVAQPGRLAVLYNSDGTANGLKSAEWMTPKLKEEIAKPNQSSASKQEVILPPQKKPPIIWGDGSMTQV